MYHTNRWIFAISFLLFVLFIPVSCSVNDLGFVENEDKRIAVFTYYDDQFVEENLNEVDLSNLAFYTKVSENNALSLYVDYETSYIAVADKRTNKVWYSIDPNIGFDPLISEDSISLSKSTLQITYLEKQTSKYTDNYSNSIERKNFSIEEIENGIKIFYKIESPNLTMNDIPVKMNPERFEFFFKNHENLVENDHIRIERYYSYNEDGYWEFIEDETKLIYMSAILERVNYTSEDLIIDNDEFGITTISNRVFFNIPVEVSLQYESLIVNIPGDEIEYNVDSPPMEVSVFPGFAGTFNATGGYMFVPDGSGALISFSPEQTKTGIYKKRVYGADRTIPLRSESGNDYSINMPVFGLKAAEDGMFAIIEDGDSISTINATRANTLSSYNNIYSSFIISESQNISVSNVATNNIPIVQKEIYTGNIRIRYSFLTKAQANYNGMANYYRTYLHETMGLDYLSDKAYSMNIDLVGTLDKEKSFMGFSYNGITKLTSFDEAEIIINQLKNEGIESINVRYSGWINNGINQYSPKKFNIQRQIGGARGLRDFNKYSIENDIDIFYNLQMLSVPSGSKYFRRFKDSSKSLDNSLARIFHYDTATGLSTTSDFIVSPEYLLEIAPHIIDQSDKYNIKNIAFDDIGKDIYSDFSNKGDASRQHSQVVHEAILNHSGESFDRIMLNQANIYSLQNGCIIINAPVNSSNHKTFDKTIPFYTMTLSGLVEFTGTPANYADDLDEYVLDLAKTGVQPFFSLMYADGWTIKNTDYNYLYNNNYELWVKSAGEIYERLKDCFADVHDKPIYSYEEIDNQVYLLTYVDETEIIINSRESGYSFKNVHIPGKDFKRVGGLE